MFFALKLQSVSIVVALAVCWSWFGLHSMLAVAYGAVIALVNSGLLVRRWYSGLRTYHCKGENHLKSFHRSSLERFFVVGVLFAVGFGFTSLLPEAVLAGFLVGQLAWALAMMLARRRF